MKISVDITATPGLYEMDRAALAWAARLAGTGEDRAEVADLAPEETTTAHLYPSVVGHARCNTRALLEIINRLAEQARHDAAEITRIRGLLTAEQIRASR